jgi:hypothetical protein
MVLVGFGVKSSLYLRAASSGVFRVTAPYHFLHHRRFYMSHLTESRTPSPPFCLQLSFLIRGARRPSLKVYFGRKKLPPPLNGDAILVPPAIFGNPNSEAIKGFQPNCVAQSSYRAPCEGVRRRKSQRWPFSIDVFWAL